MKQVISIADFATILNVINTKLIDFRHWVNDVDYYKDEQAKAREIKARKNELKKDPFYQSLLHAKKALEECKVEIEVPDLEVKDERN